MHIIIHCTSATSEEKISIFCYYIYAGISTRVKWFFCIALNAFGLVMLLACDECYSSFCHEANITGTVVGLNTLYWRQPLPMMGY